MQLKIFWIVCVMLSVLVWPVVAQEDNAASAEATAEQLITITGDAAQTISTGLESLLQELRAIPQSEVTQVVLLLGGVVLLLIGWRIYNFIIILSGALIGASLAVSLVSADGTGIQIAALLIGLVLGGVLAALLYYVAVALIGAYIGAVVTTEIAVALSLTPISIWAVVVGAILGAIILVGLSFELLVLYASIVGAQMITLALGLPAYATLALVILGVLLQITLVRRFGYDVRRRPSRRNLLARAES